MGDIPRQEFQGDRKSQPEDCNFVSSRATAPFMGCTPAAAQIERDSSVRGILFSIRHASRWIGTDARSISNRCSEPRGVACCFAFVISGGDVGRAAAASEGLVKMGYGWFLERSRISSLSEMIATETGFRYFATSFSTPAKKVRDVSAS